MNVAGIVLVALAAHRTETFLGDDLGEAQDGVQRRAQFVAHIGEKGGLGGVGGFGLEPFLQGIVAGLLQFARQILDLEAQTRILMHLAHQRPAGPPHLKRDKEAPPWR